ncbi:MAG: hypothetical protein KatS3mg115_1494 [Candidatus Poribacteria bacterium]|nr:MAG: hypothetical protein KatS3mg115_1494 [Candidatus Poribacteria bacterium]
MNPQQPPLRAPTEEVLRLQLRTRTRPFSGSDEWVPVTFQVEWPTSETALLLCDVWDSHYCSGAVRRLEAMIPRMNAVVQTLRKRGVQIVHAPSDTMEVYEGTPYRLRAQLAPKVPLPEPRTIQEPPLPIDDSDGGCDTGEEPRRAWTRQHPGIEIADPDALSDRGEEIYALFQQLGIKNMLIMGVHTNMCVLGRSFAIRQMSRWGIRCVLVRDLTDAMYNPQRPPYVAHETGTELVIQHIEQYWCPTVDSGQLLTDGLKGS